MVLLGTIGFIKPRPKAKKARFGVQGSMQSNTLLNRLLSIQLNKIAQLNKLWPSRIKLIKLSRNELGKILLALLILGVALITIGALFISGNDIATNINPQNINPQNINLQEKYGPSQYDVGQYDSGKYDSGRHNSGQYNSNQYDSNGQQSTAGKYYITRLSEKPSPKDRISEEQILVYDDKVVIELKNAEWASFADTNSMDPFIDSEANAIQIVPKAPDEIQAGDVISYESTLVDGIIIHRVVETGYDSNGWYAVTKGDNSDKSDPEKVRFEQVKRVVVAVVY